MKQLAEPTRIDFSTEILNVYEDVPRNWLLERDRFDKVIVERIPQGVIGSVCYLVICNGEGMIIDPGSRFRKIWAYVEKYGVPIKYIMITHGHVNHMIGMDELKAATGAEVIMHEGDRYTSFDQVYNGAFCLSYKQTFHGVDRYAKDGDAFEIGGQTVELVHTPGHTPGSMCIRMGNRLFTGDILFDCFEPFGEPCKDNPLQLKQSYNKIYRIMNNDFTVYPGHGHPVRIKTGPGEGKSRKEFILAKR